MYKIKKGAIQYLKDNGFQEKYDGSWVLRFPVYFYKKTPVIFCVATIWLETSKEIQLDVMNSNGVSFFLWYQRDEFPYGATIVGEIDKNIANKMHKIGARHYADR